MWKKDIMEAIEKVRTARVLSIQSHVVHGYAGNRCSVFPLQLHGFNVDVINTVQLSNHLGNVSFGTLPSTYRNCEGQKLSEVELGELYRGLEQNGLAQYEYVLTGYCSSPDFLRRLADIVGQLKLRNPKMVYFCDPVLGDHGQYYVPQNLLEVYRDLVIPVADVVTPNGFELGELTGMPVTSEEECLLAMKELHAKGPHTVVVTSGVPSSLPDNRLAAYVSTQNGVFRIEFPKLSGQFVGTGDVFTALLLAWTDTYAGDVLKAVPKVIASMQGLIQNTCAHAFQMLDVNSQLPVELQLVESRKELLFPPVLQEIVLIKIE